MKKMILCWLVLASLGSRAQVATVGKPLPEWKEGYLDLHHINTGRGNAAFFVFPDGTTMVLDAGELDPTNARTTSKRNTPIRPDDSKHPYEWIVQYIKQVAPQKEKRSLIMHSSRIFTTIISAVIIQMCLYLPTSNMH
jgi:hypothetical protein